MLPNCRRGDRCTFAHSEAEMLVWNGFRPLPNIEPYGGTYSMCTYHPDCKKGEACTFAHSEDERLEWSQLLKKKLNIRDKPKGVTPQSGEFTLCPSLPNCPTGVKCTYPHSEEEKYAWDKELRADATDAPRNEKLSKFANNPNHKGILIQQNLLKHKLNH